MRLMGVWSVVAVVVLLSGCENSKLVTCRQDNEILQAKITSMQTELDQANVALQRKDDQIAKIRTDNVDIQEKAMESIMSMLKKEEERRKQIQDAMSVKDTELKSAQEKNAASSLKISELEKHIEMLRASLAEKPAANPQIQ